MSYFSDPENLKVPEEPNAPEGETSLQLLQAIYKDKNQPLNVRVRCAIEALPFEVPKLGVTANVTVDGSFAQRLERALERSAQSSVPMLNPPTIEHEELVPASTLKKPFSSYRRA